MGAAEGGEAHVDRSGEQLLFDSMSRPALVPDCAPCSVRASSSSFSPMAPMCRASWGSFTGLLQHCANAKAAGHSGSDHNVRTRNQIRFGALRPERVKLRVPPPALALH